MMIDFESHIVAWVALIAGLVNAGAFLKFWIDIGKNQQVISDAAHDISVTMARLELINSQMSDFRVHVAQNYATNKSLSETETLLATSIRDAMQGVYTRLDAMTSRLDRLIAKEQT